MIPTDSLLFNGYLVDATPGPGCVPSPYHRHPTPWGDISDTLVENLRVLDLTDPMVWQENSYCLQALEVAKQILKKEPTKTEALEVLPWGQKPRESYTWLTMTLDKANNLTLDDAAYLNWVQKQSGWTDQEVTDKLLNAVKRVKDCPLSCLRTRVQLRWALNLKIYNSGEKSRAPLIAALKALGDDFLRPGRDLKRWIFYSTPHPRFGYYRFLDPLVTSAPSLRIRNLANTYLLEGLLDVHPPKYGVKRWYEAVVKAIHCLSPEHVADIEPPGPLEIACQESFSDVTVHFAQMRLKNREYRARI